MGRENENDKNDWIKIDIDNERGEEQENDDDVYIEEEELFKNLENNKNNKKYERKREIEFYKNNEKNLEEEEGEGEDSGNDDDNDDDDDEDDEDYYYETENGDIIVKKIVIEDPIAIFCFFTLNQLGIRSIFLTTLYAGIIEGTMTSFPFYFGYSTVSSFFAKVEPNDMKKSLFLDTGRIALRRSFATGIFFGLTTGIDDYLQVALLDYPQVSEFLRLSTSIGLSLALSIGAYRKPKYVLPNLAVLSFFGFFGVLP